MKLPAPLAALVEFLLGALVPARGVRVDGRRDGLWVQRVGSLELRATTYRAGLKHGRETRRYLDGTKRSIGEWEHGAQTGEWFFFGRDARLDPERTGHYRDGLRFSAIRGFNDWK